MRCIRRCSYSGPEVFASGRNTTSVVRVTVQQQKHTIRRRRRRRQWRRRRRRRIRRKKANLRKCQESRNKRSFEIPTIFLKPFYLEHDFLAGAAKNLNNWHRSHSKLGLGLLLTLDIGTSWMPKFRCYSFFLQKRVFFANIKNRSFLKKRTLMLKLVLLK